MIITLSRQIGAGGAEVAAIVADRLGWTVVDNQLIDEVAVRAGLAPEEVAERQERAPGFAERLARTLASSMPEFVAPEGGTLPDLTEERLKEITEKVVADLASQGRVVMVGRAAPAVLASQPDAMHVKVVAPVAWRVTRVGGRDGLDPKHAERRVLETDANRARYHKQHYGRDWNDAANYHLVVNTAALGLDGAAEIILAAAARLGMR